MDDSKKKTVDQIKREIKELVQEAAAQGCLISQMNFYYLEPIGSPPAVLEIEIMERIK